MSNSRELKKVLADTLELEAELYNLCLECLKRIYGENGNVSVGTFEEYVEQYNIHRWVPNLHYFDNVINQSKKSEKNESKD